MDFARSSHHGAIRISNILNGEFDLRSPFVNADAWGIVKCLCEHTGVSGSGGKWSIASKMHKHFLHNAVNWQAPQPARPCHTWIWFTATSNPGTISVRQMGNENNRPEGNDGSSGMEVEIAYLEYFIHPLKPRWNTSKVLESETSQIGIKMTIWMNTYGVLRRLGRPKSRLSIKSPSTYFGAINGKAPISRLWCVNKEAE